ncbi:MAG: hypothetical protein IKD85_01730 [Firmicutes bacterium]|nr:hypothetical protein [Bacillota bacterium]
MNLSIFDADRVRRETKEKFGVNPQIHDPCGGNLYFTLEEPNEEAAAYIAGEFRKFGLEMEIQEDGHLLTFHKIK